MHVVTREMALLIGIQWIEVQKQKNKSFAEVKVS